VEAMLGISLYSCPYLQLAKTLCLSYYCLCLLFIKTGEKGRTGSAWKQGGREGGGREQRGEMAQTVYAQMNKFFKNIKTSKQIKRMFIFSNTHGHSAD
jgi:hypothetical protein